MNFRLKTNVPLLIGFALLFLINTAVADRILVDASQRKTDTLASIQAAVDRAAPGDTIEIFGGVYFEKVLIKNSGEEGRPITIQAAPNELVLINAGQPLRVNWDALPEHPNVFVASVPENLLSEKSGLWETPSRLRLAKVNSISQVVNRLGAWFFDSASGKIYLRSSGAAPANHLAYWIEDPKDAALTVKASHIQIRDLQVTLGQNGILINPKTSHVLVEGCRAFCNSWAGIHVTGDEHRIQHNETFSNNTYGIQLRYGVNKTWVRQNLCIWNGPDNGAPTGSSVPTDLGIYSKGGFNLIEGNTVEGAHEDVYRNKTGYGPNNSNVLRNNVIKGNQTPSAYGVYNNTLLVSGLGMRTGMYRNGGGASPMRSWEAVDKNGLQRASNLIHPLFQKENPHFADPSYRDYRLQADSPYLGFGAFPGHEEVYYVDPKNGSDSNSGLSLSEALATPQAAVARMGGGATIYLLPGDYSEPLEISNGGLDRWNPLRIRAYGKQFGVRVSGGITINRGQFLELDGIEVTAPLVAKEYQGLVVKNCVFIGADAGISVLASPLLLVDQCTFTKNKISLQLSESSSARVTQSLFVDCEESIQADVKSAFSLYSDRNAFSKFHGKFGESLAKSLSEWQSAGGQDRQSVEKVISLSENYASAADEVLSMLAADFGGIGARDVSQASHLAIENLRVAGLSPKGATLLWDLQRQAAFAEITLKDADGKSLRSWEPSWHLQVMATQFDITRMMEAFYSSKRHAGISGLQPDTEYTAEVTLRDLKGTRSEVYPITFKTPKEFAAPTSYYLSPDGQDSADGKSRETPWKSFSYALAQVNPGDEVILLPGKYHEILRPQISGTPEHPITIRSETPQAAILDMSKSLPVAVEILNTNYIVLDGVLISNGYFPTCNAYIINHAKGITIRNCEIDWPAVGNFEKPKLSYNGLLASEAPGLTVENNLFLCCNWGVSASHSPGTVIRQNSFIAGANYGIVIIPKSPEDTYTIENNLFYRATFGYKTGSVIRIFAPLPHLICDYNLFYIAPEDKATIGSLIADERFSPLEAWVKGSGLDKNSRAEKPVFEDPDKRNFTLKEDSPGKGMSNNGSDVGRIRK
ncbi:MAG: right-handed parallel beta-helix repeat-containing protein [Chthoniobacterales bacterium]